MPTAIFFGGIRTPFCRAHKGALADLRPDDMLVELLAANQARLPNELNAQTPDDLIVGCAYPEGEQGYNLARMVSIGLNWPVPGVTVNRLCASSLEAVGTAAGQISGGWGKYYAVGGVESMSRIVRRGASFSESELIKKANPHAYVANGETAGASPVFLCSCYAVYRQRRGRIEFSRDHRGSSDPDIWNPMTFTGCTAR